MAHADGDRIEDAKKILQELRPENWIFILDILNGMTVAEIANKHRMSVTAVEKRISKGKLNIIHRQSRGKWLA